jgi:copper(I)-binding protein
LRTLNACLKNNGRSHCSWRLLCVTLTTLLLMSCSEGGGITIESAWARPASEGDNSAIYFEIHNAGAFDRLLGAETGAAEQVMLHRTVIDAAGNASMQMQASVEIPAGQTVLFEPGGLHVMLVDLHRELEVGDQIALRLQFERGSEVALQVPVGSP